MWFFNAFIWYFYPSPSRGTGLVKVLEEDIRIIFMLDLLVTLVYSDLFGKKLKKNSCLYTLLFN